jgi:ATP-dependent Clp endopeptidase proteolytic subunit ClpP
MQTIEILNKSGKVKLNETVTRESIGKMIDEIGKLFGSTASASGADFGEIMNVAENAVDVLDIEINSPGGSVFDGYTIYQEIKSLQDRGVVVNATITGMAASMASVIAMACDKVSIVPHGRMMIHDASSGVQGNAEQLRKSADLLDSISDNIADIYASRTGIPKEEIRGLMKKETWMTAEECLSNKFVDAIFDIRHKDARKSSMNLFKNFINALSPDEKIEFAAQAAEVDSLQNALVEAQAKIEELSNISAIVLEKEVKIQDLTDKNANLEFEVSEAQAKIKDLESQVIEKEAAAAEATQSAGEQAIEMIASIGQSEPLALDATGDEPKDIIKELSNLSGSERTKFYNENKAEIRKQLSK